MAVDQYAQDSVGRAGRPRGSRRPSRFSCPVPSPSAITAQDEADLALLRSSLPHREALARLTPGASPVEQALSESLLLHCVLAAGFEAIRRSAEEAGYEGLAAQYAEQADHRRKVARRRPPAWAKES